MGSGALVRWLLHEELLDELMLMVHPIVLGRGWRLFEEGGDQKALKLRAQKEYQAARTNYPKLSRRRCRAPRPS